MCSGRDSHWRYGRELLGGTANKQYHVSISALPRTKADEENPLQAAAEGQPFFFAEIKRPQGLTRRDGPSRVGSSARTVPFCFLSPRSSGHTSVMP